VHAKEALADLWEVEDKQLPNFLAIEEKLTKVDETLQSLLKDSTSSFGGTYLDVKKNKVFVNTVDITAINKIKNSPKFSQNDFLNFIEFIKAPANNSMDILTSKLKKIVELIKKYRPINIQCYIDMTHNNVVIRFKTDNNAKNSRFINEASQYDVMFIQPNASPHPRCQVQRKSPSFIINGNPTGLIKSAQQTFRIRPWDTDYVTTLLGKIIEPVDTTHDFSYIELI
ncbi:31238_t:CDS:2, partial [Racocetra persica]